MDLERSRMPRRVGGQACPNRLGNTRHRTARVADRPHPETPSQRAPGWRAQRRGMFAWMLWMGAVTVPLIEIDELTSGDGAGGVRGRRSFATDAPGYQ